MISKQISNGESNFEYDKLSYNDIHQDDWVSNAHQLHIFYSSIENLHWLAAEVFGGSAHSRYMGVSKNRGTPKSSILIGFSLINHPFWGTPIFGNTHIRNDNPFLNAEIPGITF